MNNFKYYNDSLAYDFDLFMPTKKEKKENVIKMPENKSNVKRRKAAVNKAVSVSLVSVLISAFFLAAVCGNIYLRIRINETNTEINKVNTEINELEAEYTKLYVDMEKIVSYNNLESAAAKLGMKKMDKDQVVYIHVNDKNAAVTSKGEKVVSNE